MKEAKVVGIKYVNYTSKKTGANVSGKQLNIVYPAQTDDVVGEEVGTVYVSSSAPEADEVDSIEVGEYIRFVTTFQFGKYANVYAGRLKK